MTGTIAQGVAGQIGGRVSGLSQIGSKCPFEHWQTQSAHVGEGIIIMVNAAIAARTSLRMAYPYKSVPSFKFGSFQDTTQCRAPAGMHLSRFLLNSGRGRAAHGRSLLTYIL